MENETDTHQASLVMSVQIINEPLFLLMKSSLTNRMLRDDFRFEARDSSHNPTTMQNHDNHMLESSFANFHLEPTNTNCPTHKTNTETLPTLTEPITGLPTNDEAHCPGPLAYPHFSGPHAH
ncbi:hypothetical protein FCV25MIE_34457 [Fagus crenata]